MVEVKNIEVFNIERAIKAINNSYNTGEINTLGTPSDKLFSTAKVLGSNMDAHQSHDAYLKGILVSFDIKLNLVIQPELQRSHFFEIIMQQSRMHSMEKFMNAEFDPFTKYVSQNTRDEAKKNYKAWRNAKEKLKQYYDENKDNIDEKTAIKLNNDVYTSFEILIHNLPCGIELWATCSTNYLQLKTIVIQRFHHKNKEDWGALIEACYLMPHFRELCGFNNKKWDLGNW